MNMYLKQQRRSSIGSMHVSSTLFPSCETPRRRHCFNVINAFPGSNDTVIDVEDAEIHFAVDEYLDHTVSTKPVIYISPNEIYLTHSLIMQDLDLIVSFLWGGTPSSCKVELYLVHGLYSLGSCT